MNYGLLYCEDASPDCIGFSDDTFINTLMTAFLLHACPSPVCKQTTTTNQHDTRILDYSEV